MIVIKLIKISAEVFLAFSAVQLSFRITADISCFKDKSSLMSNTYREVDFSHSCTIGRLWLNQSKQLH